VKQFLSSLSSRYSYSLILLRQLVITDFKLRYQGSFLGYVWSLLKPLALFSILYVVFVRFLRFGVGPVPLFLGIVLWTYFSEVTLQGIGSIVGRGDLMRKLNFPRYVIVLSTAFSALINLFLNLVVVGIFMIFTNTAIRLSALILPLLIIELFVLSVALAFFLSALFVRFRDLSHIWELVLQAGFYMTPIIYTLNFIPPKYAKYLILSPLAQIIQDARYVLLDPHAQTITTFYPNPLIRLVPLGIVAVIAVVSANYFRCRAPYFAEEV
jgi:ABC-2 type transport system permease protein